MKKRILYLLLFIPLFGYSTNLKVSPIFSDNMIIQRNEEVCIYGKAIPNNVVKLTSDSKKYSTVALNDSLWQIVLPPLEIGKEYAFTITSGEEIIALKNILAGDVWLCSGQSNMEFQMSSFPWCEVEIQQANDNQIRFYSVPNAMDLIPAKDLPQGGNWKVAMGEDLKQCSATAFFFAKGLRSSLDVPVGIICSDWSGTAIEPWMPQEAFSAFPKFDGEIRKLTKNKKSRAQIESDFAELRKTWDDEHYLTGKGIKDEWYKSETDFSDWMPCRLSDGYWGKSNPDLANFDGSVWYKTTFDLPEDYKGGNYHLHLNYVKDYNTTWVNGVKIGETFGHHNWSDYYVPENVLKEKDNVVVVRVMNVEGDGGFNFHPLWGTPILNGQWYCKADEPLSSDFVEPQIVNVNPFARPSILYNAMIAPLSRINIKGVIWYQGESNAGRGYEYRHLFPAMISSWRSLFNQAELPFYFVQLANYEEITNSNGESDWAEIRESQYLTAKMMNKVKMIPAIDLGEEKDIHPINKQEVGKRLADAALADCYRLISENKYPEIQKCTFKGNRVFVEVSEKLAESKNVNTFSIAGEDKVFHEAKVTFNKGRIILTSPNVKNPIAVRYAWAKNPGELLLLDTNGLPLLPYRSDDWKGLTDDRVYDPNIVYF